MKKKKTLIFLLVVVMLISMGAFLFGMLGDCNTPSCGFTLNRSCNTECRYYGGCLGYYYDYGFCYNWLCAFEVTVYCADGFFREIDIYCSGTCPI